MGQSGTTDREMKKEVVLRAASRPMNLGLFAAGVLGSLATWVFGAGAVATLGLILGPTVSVLAILNFFKDITAGKHRFVDEIREEWDREDVVRQIALYQALLDRLCHHGYVQAARATESFREMTQLIHSDETAGRLTVDRLVSVQKRGDELISAGNGAVRALDELLSIGPTAGESRHAFSDKCRTHEAEAVRVSAELARLRDEILSGDSTLG